MNGEIMVQLPIGMAIFMELFCSIHMSVFVLQPLAEFINPDKKTSLFLRFFVIRAVILFIGNFITTYIALLDFFAIFIGAFIVIPVLHGLKKEKQIEKNVKSDNYAKADLQTELEKIGIFDSELLKRELYNIFIKYKTNYSNKNFEILIPLCDEKFLDYTKQKIDFVSKKEYKDITENFTLNSVKIEDVYSNEKLQKLSILFDISCTEYLMNKNGKVLKGNPYNVTRKMMRVTFKKKIYSENIHRKCPSCGAPVMPYDITCDYCTATIPNENDWRISQIEEDYKGRTY